MGAPLNEGGLPFPPSTLCSNPPSMRLADYQTLSPCDIDRQSLFYNCFPTSSALTAG